MSKHQKTVKQLIKGGIVKDRAVLMVVKANGLSMRDMEFLHFSVRG